jgi:ribosomal protein L2
MALKKFNPTTPGQRNLVLVDKSDLYKRWAGQEADRGFDQDRWS